MPEETYGLKAYALAALILVIGVILHLVNG